MRERKAREQADNDVVLRKLLDQKAAHAITITNVLKQSDRLKQLSGINHVIARKATETNTTLIVELDAIRTLPKPNKARYLARMIELIKVCRKYHTSLVLENAHDTSLLLSLGASTAQAAKARAQSF